MRKIVTMLLVGFLVVAAAARAHNGRSHRLMGTVKALHGDVLTVTDAHQADHAVGLTVETRLTKAGKAATRAELTPGTRVSVHLAENDKVAVEVKIGVAGHSARGH
jgi:hypothetical protein